MGSASNVRGKPASSGVGGDDKRFKELQDQVSSILSAREADAERMEAERAKVVELQENQLALSRELAAAKSQELVQRRELVTTSDELENLKRKHSREVDELEMDLRKKEREIRELKEDVRVLQGDLDRERENASQLKSTVSHQSTAQLTLTTQCSALQAHNTALQSALDAEKTKNSALCLDLESSAQTTAQLKQEAREAEMMRRKLHNMVQELKGNIRVFCRIRPVLSSDFPSSVSGSSSSATLSTSSCRESPGDAVTEASLTADMVFPDQRDHREIALSSTGESATGQERKENWSFSFDRVSSTCFINISMCSGLIDGVLGL